MPEHAGLKKETRMSVSLAELKDKNITDLAKIAKELNIPGSSGMR
ncbi:MAG: Rho termination factor N-terminal domain-containing protein, partial [Acidobacteriota bacterium]|nr:Rho termination factor N-terminal domain-containing protein [Acidobacteriota bacterium]